MDQSEGTDVDMSDVHIPWLSWATDRQVNDTFTNHAQALSGSAFDSSKNLPETANTLGEVTMAMVQRKQKTNTDAKQNCATLNESQCFCMDKCFQFFCLAFE